jgi:predicted amidophosphoribosyltransferase
VLRTLTGDLLDVLFPPRCPGCSRRGATVCDACVRTLRAPPATPPPPGVTWWAAPFAYEGVARELIARAKYRNERGALTWLASHVARACDIAPARVDVVTWAPASAARRARFGVDHGELLASEVATRLDRPLARLLDRGRGPAQTGRDAASRRHGPDLRARHTTVRGTVLVVDDVATTGGTLTAAARALHTAGATETFAATAARTPFPGRASRRPAYTSGPGTS